MSSEVHSTVESLRTLHRIHQQLEDLRERLERGPRMLKAHQANIERQEAQTQQLRDELKKLKAATDDKQMQLSSAEAGVEKRRGQMRQAKDNREYQALKEEIAATEMANSVMADEILEAMEKLDGLQKKAADADAATKNVQAQAEKTHLEVEKQQPLIEGDIRRLEGELKQLEATLPEDFRAHYSRVVRTKGVEALAPVLGEFCGGCNHQVPVNLISLLMQGQPVLCKSCGRLLYMPEARE